MLEICIFAGLLGLLWGSFFNVCIFRIPENKSVIWKPSHCRSCEKPLRWFHNIPVLSFLFLKGKCSQCGNRISIQYPLVEILTAGLFIWTGVHYGLNWQGLFYTVFLSSLLVITVIDLQHMIIPDELSLSGILLGFIASFFTNDIVWWESLLGAALGGGIFLGVALLYEKVSKQEGLGGGDIKLLAMIGAWLGYKSIPIIIVISSAVGSIVGLGFMLIKKRNLKTAIPFGPFLALAALIYLVWGLSLQQYFFPSY